MAINVSSFRHVVALVLLALWLPATQHCGLEAAGLIGADGPHVTHEGCAGSNFDHCTHDGCNVVESGLVKFENVMSQLRGQNGASQIQLKVLQGDVLGEQTVAVYVEGTATIPGTETKADEKADDKKEADKKEAAKDEKAAESSAGRKIRAFYVSDMDCLTQYFYESRRRPEDLQINLRVQNITFFLNVIDILAGESNYPKVRSHEPRHASLRLFERQAQVFQKAETENQKKYQEEFSKVCKV